MRKFLTLFLLAVTMTIGAKQAGVSTIRLHLPVNCGISGNTNICYKGKTIKPIFDDNHQAIIQLSCDDFGYCTLTFQRRRIPLFVENGKTVCVSSCLDGNNLKLRIEGDNTDVNAFLNSTSAVSAGENEYALIYSHFIGALDKLFLKNDSILSHADIPDGFKEKERSRQMFHKKTCIAAYYTFHNRIMNERHMESSSPIIPQEYFNALESMLVDDDQMLVYPDYIDFNKLAVLAIVQNNKKELTQAQIVSDYSRYVVTHFQSDVTRQILLNEIILPYVENQGIKGMKETNRIYRENVSDTSMLANYHRVYEKWDRLLPGKPMPDFTFTDSSGIQYSKNDFRGKVVYFDLWATWCPPCCAEIPYMNRLAKLYAHNANIVFVGISVDKDKEVWKKKIANSQMQGIQLFAGPDCFLMEYTNKTAIPHYIIMDKEGCFVDADAPRPSDPLTASLLEDCLK